MDTLSRETTLSKLLCPLSEKGSTLKGKNLLPWEQILSFQSRSLFREAKRGLL